VGGRDPGAGRGLRDAADRELADGLAAQDEAALAEVVRRHRPAVVAFARRLTGDAARAEEIAQEVVMRLWERPERYDATRGTIRSFLMATTHGRALDAMRSDTARGHRERRHVAEPAPPPPSVESTVIARTVAQEVNSAIATLPETERQVVELSYLAGQTYREVARRLDLPEGTVKSRIRSGLGRLRRELAGRDLHS
jgi:RNA polymerase sigma-70 factor (ECF subfamily)